MKFKRIKLSLESTNKLKSFKTKTGVTPNIACRLGLAISLDSPTKPSTELYDDEGQEINRYTFLGEHETILLALHKQWCADNKIEKDEHFIYFSAHINRGVEMLTNRVKSLDSIVDIL